MKKIAISNNALRTLRRMSRNPTALVVSKIELFASNPAALGQNLKPLEGGGEAFRLRAGNWCVIMIDDGQVIAVVKIGPRVDPRGVRGRSMPVQFIDTPSGRFAVLPEEDYRRLAEAAEDMTDLATIERFRQRLAAGEEELVPAAVVKRLLAGEHPLRVWREHRGLSMQALAEAAGLSQAYVSQIETSKREGSLSAVKALAAALNLAVDDLLP